MGRGTYLGGSTIIFPRKESKDNSFEENRPFVFQDEVELLHRLVRTASTGEAISKATIAQLRSKLSQVTLNRSNYTICQEFLPKESEVVTRAQSIILDSGEKTVEILTKKEAAALLENDRRKREEIKQEAKAKHREAAKAAQERKRQNREIELQKLAQSQQAKQQKKRIKSGFTGTTFVEQNPDVEVHKITRSMNGALKQIIVCYKRRPT